MLSAYELQREDNIKKNEARLKALGLSSIVPAKAKRAPPAKKRKASDDPEYKPELRNTRSRNPTAPAARDDSDDDDDDDDYEEEKVKPTRKPKAAKVEPKDEDKAAPDFATASSGGAKCVVVEAAKTGRSKCRGCMEALAAGELRVGMESWMVGRQVVVWQHPACFLKTVEVAEEATGRGKCKQTKEGFAAGEHKLCFEAHTTKAYIKLRAGGELLGPVLHAAGRADARLAEVVGGFSALSKADAAALQAGVDAALAEKKPGEGGSGGGGSLEVGATPTLRDALEQESAAKQPAAGAVAKATGRVAWKWAGTLCYGTLMPGSESKTHCYARTQKGNVKTLTKGGAYWWML